MSETPENCTKLWYEPCRLHPVDCSTCINEPVCQMKADMQAHKDQIKRCRSFRRKEGASTPKQLSQKEEEKLRPVAKLRQSTLGRR